MRATGENHQGFGKLASGGTEKVDSVSPASSDVRLEAERQYEVEPAESALNPTLAAPLSEAKEDSSIEEIAWSELDGQLDLLLREEKKRSEAVHRAEEDASKEACSFEECVGIKEIEPEERAQVLALVERVLAEQVDVPGRTHLIEHRIRLTNPEPVRHKNRHTSPALLEAARNIVDQWHEDGIVERSDSEYSSAPVLVKKSDGTFRMCIDYRDLNARTAADAYPAPSLETILDSLRGARYISKIDLKSAFLQVPMEEQSKKYTAFSVLGSGLWQFRNMPFGLRNSPSTFNRLVDTLFGPRCHPHVFVYLDDILIVTDNFAEHLLWVEYVLRKLAAAGLKMNRNKCEFCCSRVLYLGYLLDSEGLRPDPGRIAPIVNYPAPTTVKQLRRFLGMVGYYARFLSHDSEMKIPLNKLLRKSQVWEWGPEQQEAFEALKAALTSAPVLARPDFTKPFTIQCDASRRALGGVLTQVDEDGVEHPIVYISQTLKPAEMNYSVSELECLGVLWSIKKLRAYVEAHPFTVITDHSALLWLKNLKDPTGRLARWALRMQQWDFQIKHRKGTLHSVPDALSRIYEENGELILVDSFSEEVIKKDEWYMRMMENVKRTPEKYRSWKIEDGRLYRYHYSALLDPVLNKEENWKLVVPEELRERVICDAHSSPSMGHFGIE